MKVKPVMDALEARSVEVALVHTGQHYDASMSEIFLAELGIRPPDRSLGVGSGTHAGQTGRVMAAFEPVVDELAPDVVLVVGDVNSTMACALVAAKAGALVAHVEAGLRSRDWTMPEEVNRVVTDRVSDYLFAPSRDAAENLGGEGYRADQIHLVGNVMVDALLSNLEQAQARPLLAELGLRPGGYGVVTPRSCGICCGGSGLWRGSARWSFLSIPVPGPSSRAWACLTAFVSSRLWATWTFWPWRPGPAWCSRTPVGCRRRRRCWGYPA